VAEPVVRQAIDELDPRVLNLAVRIEQFAADDADVWLMCCG